MERPSIPSRSRITDQGCRHENKRETGTVLPKTDVQGNRQTVCRKGRGHEDWKCRWDLSIKLGTGLETEGTRQPLKVLEQWYSTCGS